MAQNHFDPAIASRIMGYELRSRRLAEGFKEGHHKSRLVGMSTSFAQHRPYAPGDDPRHLDWKALAKTDRYYIRQYEAETNLSCLFLLDSSSSMFFRSSGAAMSKFDYAATVASTLAYLLYEQKDPFGLVLFDQQIRSALPARSTGAHLRQIFDALSNVAAGGQTDLGQVLLAMGPRLKRRGLTVIISDFLCELDSFGLGIGQLAFKGHDVLLLLIEDPLERDLAMAGTTVLLGPEKEGRLICDPRDYVVTYQNERERHHQAIRDTARRFGYFFELLPTDGAIDVALSTVLAARVGRR